MSAAPKEAAPVRPAPPRPAPPPSPAPTQDEVDAIASAFTGPSTEKYVLGPLLGEGGFASVYAARHAQIPSLRLAVKVLRPEHAENPDVRERFASEARTAAALRGPNIVRVTDVGETANGLPFMVMEYVNGAPLDRLLERCGSLRTLSVARLTVGVLEALEEAHGLGVIHRDLKPANLLVASQPGHEHPIARVLDFGIAKVLDTHAEGLIASKATVGSHVLCTPQYAAPEVLRGTAVFASDLYALGHLMAEMLDGDPPYAQGSAFEIAARQLESTPVPLGPIARTSPLGAIIERACSKNVEDRYESATAMKKEVLGVVHALEARQSRGAPNEGPSPRLGRGQRDTPRSATAPPPLTDEPHQSPRTIGAIAEALDAEADRATSTAANPIVRAQRIARRARTKEEGPRPRAHTVLVRPDRIEGELARMDAVTDLPTRPARAPAPDALPIMESELHFGTPDRRMRAALWAAGAAALVLLTIVLARSAGSPDGTSARATSAAGRGGAMGEASARVARAAAVPAEHAFTFTSSVDGGEVWYAGRRLGALPRFDVFGPSTRPITVEFRHPDFRSVEVTHTAPGAVSIRAPFSRRARRPTPPR